jgi:hypothetical protein
MTGEISSCLRKVCLGTKCTDVVGKLLDPDKLTARCRKNLRKHGVVDTEGQNTPLGQAIVEEVQGRNALTQSLRKTYREPLQLPCITIITRSSCRKVRPSGLDSDGYPWRGSPNDR